jgi:hypothetical protein
MIHGEYSSWTFPRFLPSCAGQRYKADHGASHVSKLIGAVATNEDATAEVE